MRVKKYAAVLLISFAVFLPMFPRTGVAQTEAKAQDAENTITFDFRNAELKTVVEFMARLSNLIVIIDEKITGKITVSSPNKLTIAEAYGVLMSVLDVRGLTLVKNDKFLKVVQKADAIQSPLEIFYGAAPESVPDEDRVVTHILPVVNSDANEIQANLRPLISRTGNVFINKDTNAVVVTDAASNIRRLLKLVGHLDVKRIVPGKTETKVYPVRYMKAKDIGDALQKMHAGQGSEKSDVKITPVDSVNAIIVTADAGILAQIDKTISTLDIRRRQVLIEAKIIEVSLEDNFDFGIELQKFADSSRDFSYVATMGSELKNPYMSFTLTNDKINAVLRMAESKGNIKILSTPRIMTSDNQKAKIVVGQEEPILKSTTNLGVEGGAAGKTVSDYIFKDVGITLDVTPRINIDRDVALDVSFSITSILSMVDFKDVSVPRVGKREASTSVSVMDGRTLVIGGLIKNDNRDGRSGVPFLSSIPLLGWLFSKISKAQQRTELLVFITPQVITTVDEGTVITEKEKDKMGIDFKKIDQDRKSPDNRKKEALK